MKRCRVGDRALIIKSTFPENLGAEVIVTREGLFFDWVIEGVNKFIQTATGQKKEVGSRDDSLMPIRPSDEKFLEDELTRELEGVQ